jgi:dihydrolipoamide dehydrogenase
MLYDVIFIGGGPAGYEGGIAAAKKGLKVAVVELDKLGGTCLQRGCIPTKTYLHSIKVLEQLKSCSKLGLKTNDFIFDIDNMIKQKNRVISKLTNGIEFLFNKNNVDLINGKARVISEDTVLINEEQELKSKNIVISTGSKPSELPFLKVDGEYVINSDIALDLKKIPDRLLVVGAGAVGLEIGTIYNYLGSEVYIVEIFDNILPGLDIELSVMLEKELRKQKINIYTSTFVSEPLINRDKQTIKISFKRGDKKWEEEFSKVLLSVGRFPNIDNLFDKSLNIKRDKKGFIKVNNNLQTGVPNIFACGDVVGEPLLAHKASHQAIGIVDFIRERKKILKHTIPAAVFTFPEFASVGLSEERAKEKGIDIKIGRFPYSAGSRSNAIDEKTGIVKIIADKNNVIIGAHILGAEAGELMPLLTYAISEKKKTDDFKDIQLLVKISGKLWVKFQGFQYTSD